MPYTYLIGWSTLNTYYYGVRYSKHATPDDLWIKYKTSSKYVKLFYAEHGEPDIIMVRKTFDSADKALMWESKVLRRMNMAEDVRFLNRWDNNMVPLNVDGPYPFCDANIQNKIDKKIKEMYDGRGSGSNEIKQKVFDTCTAKYGKHHTLHTEKVVTAREERCLELYGVTNPFYSKEFQATLKNPMDDPKSREKLRNTLKNKDWGERNEYMKKYNSEKYGVSCVLNTPENIAKRKNDVYVCPHGCKNNYAYGKANFVQHMIKNHQWEKDKIYEYCDENKKNQN